MKCPFCKADDTRVIDSRPSDAGASIRRRRRCPTCDGRFTTYERPVAVYMVVKRNGLVEEFDPQKLRSGIERAVADRIHDAAVFDGIVSRVQALVALRGGTIASQDIGGEVLEALREIDEVAYLRFASVYKEFQGTDDFERELATLDD